MSRMKYLLNTYNLLSLSEAFRKLGNTIKKIVEAFRNIFVPIKKEKIREKRKVKGTSPREYGMFLNEGRSSKSCSKVYNYIPAYRKNLPYQRRKF